MLSGKAIVFVSLCVVVSAIPITLPFGDMKASLAVRAEIQIVRAGAERRYAPW